MYNLLFWQGGLINLEKRRRVSGTSLSHLKYIPFFILIFHSRHKQRCTDNVLSALHACVVGCVPRVCTVKVNRAGWTYWYLFFFLEHDMCIYLQGTFYNSFVTVQSLALLLFGRLCIHRGIRTACRSVYGQTFLSLSLQEFEVLSQIRVLQASCSQYNLPHHPRVAAWLRGYMLLTDQERWDGERCLFSPRYRKPRFKAQ